MALLAGLALAISPPAPQPNPVTADGFIELAGTAGIDFSPVTLADLNHDGRDEILVGTSDGKVFALTYSSGGNHLQVMWSHDLANDIGSPAAVHGAVSVADLNGDGNLAVVVPAGEVNATTNYQGGVVALNASDGSTRWIFRTFDKINTVGGAGTPEGHPDAVVSTPAIADLNGDGRQEVVFGGLDHRVYVLDANGKVEPGWPVFVRDTVWSSAALADLDGDGLLEIVVGVDAHNEGPPFNTQNGGCLYAFRLDGTVYWRQCVNQVIYSSPVIGDLDHSGQLDVIHGTGDFFVGGNPAPVPTIYAWNGNGTPKWSVGTNGFVREGVALAKLEGTSQLDVVASTVNAQLQAFRHDGGSLWTRGVLNYLGQANGPISAPILAVYNTADSIPDAFANVLWDTAVHNGQNGAPYTQVANNTAPPAYHTDCTSRDNGPAVGDVDGDGLLELVAASAQHVGSGCTPARVYYWNLSSAASAANTPWPMFGQNAQHTRVYPQSLALDSLVVAETLPSVMLPGSTVVASLSLRNTGTSAWSSTTPIGLGAVGDSDPFTSQTRLSLNSGEVVNPGQTRTFTVSLHAPTIEGYYTTDWRMVSDANNQWFGRMARVVVKVGNQPALHVLTTQGAFAGGLATSAYPPPNPGCSFPPSVAWKLTADRRGYYLVQNDGNVCAGAGTFPLYPTQGLGDSRDIALGPDGISYYVINGGGTIKGCDPDGCRRSFNPPPPTVGSARSLALTADGNGIFILDGFGNVFRGGNAPNLSAPSGVPVGGDIFRRIKLTANGSGYYLMDMHGRVYNGGSAPPLSPANYSPQLGQDWARDFELTADGQGYYLLDEFDHIYTGGNATPLTQNLPPVFSNDSARDLELVDTRRASGLSFPNSLAFMIQAGDGSPLQEDLALENAGAENIQWSASTDSPSAIGLSPTSGTVIAGGSPGLLQIRIKNPQNFGVGNYNFGVTVRGLTAAVVSVKLFVVANLHRMWLPLLAR